MRHRIVVALLAALVARSAGADGPKVVDYETSDGAIRLQVPDDWGADDSGIGGSLVAFAAPGKDFTAFIITSTKAGSSELPAEVSRMRASMEKGGMKFLEDRAIEIDGAPARELVFEDPEIAKTNRFLMVRFAKKTYRFMFTAHTTGWAKQQPTFAAMQKSIRWVRSERYRPKGGKLTLEVPDGWLVDAIDETGKRFAFVGPKAKTWSTAIHVASVPLAGPFEAAVDGFLAKREKKSDMEAREADVRRYLLFDGTSTKPGSKTARSVQGRSAVEAVFFLKGYQVPSLEPDDDPFTLKPPFDSLDVHVVNVFVRGDGGMLVFTLVSIDKDLAPAKQVLDRCFESLRFDAAPEVGPK